MSALHLQGYKPAEDLVENDIVDGVCGPVEIESKALRPRADMVPLVMIVAKDGQRLRFEPAFPVAFYGPDPVYLEKHGRNPLTAPMWEAREQRV